MSNKVEQELKIHGLTIQDLTPSELEQLEKELEFKENGGMILDGVLSDPSIYTRALKNKR